MLLVDLCGKYQTVLKHNKLLEVQKPKGKKKCGNMTDKELALALKADSVRFYGCKCRNGLVCIPPSKVLTC